MLGLLVFVPFAFVLGLVFGFLGLREAKKTGKGKGMAIAGLVLSALWALVTAAVLVFVLTDDSVSATDVKVGDCLKEIPTEARVVSVDAVMCDQPHLGEVFAVLVMPDGPFPGDEAVQQFAQGCRPALLSYAPAAPYVDSPVKLLHPTRDSWEKQDRSVVCIATTLAPRSGSLKR